MFYSVLQTAWQPQVKHRGLFGIKNSNFCSRDAPRCVPHKHDTSDFFFFNYYYSGASNKHYNFCDYFLPLIISVTLHTDLWKLAPYFKKKKKKKSLLLYVCYKRTIDCGMQFKDDICQQMPCIIWHCRNSNLFLFWK